MHASNSLPSHHRPWLPPIVLLLLMLMSGSATCQAATQDGGQALIDLGSAASEQRISASSTEVTFMRRVDAQGAQIEVAIKPGQDGYPGIAIKPEGAAWDLSAFGYVEARVVNTSAKRMSMCLRVDNDGDWQKNPWNGEVAYLEPGATGTVTVIFGFSWGKPAYALDPTKVTRAMLFAGKSDAAQSFRVESIRAGGSAGESPKPQDGLMLGSGRTLDATKQLERRGGAEATMAASSVRVSLPKAAAEAGVLLRPAVRPWDLRDHTQISIRARNSGKSPLALRARAECVGGASEWVSPPRPVAAGEEVELIIPFASGTAWNGEPGSGSQFSSDAVTGVAILATASDADRELMVEVVRAGVPAQKLPEWLGKRPPVDGAWKQTLDEDFDGKAIDDKRWSVIGDNFWDKQSHFSVDNTIVGGGMAKLRFEKKRGHANDDPAKPETDYTTGFLTSFGKWTQRYGYFEARMKLPSAPGLWPAFWTMPDRGASDGIWWKRQRTQDGGMEHDIMEYLTRYGPNRYNIALHWDGYEKDHKMVGTDRNYVLPDKDGFIVTGMLWEPGKLTFYGNGAVLATWANPRVSDVPAYILFTHVSGGWGGNDLTGERLPDDFVVDWVRCWQRDDLAALPAKPLAP